MNVISESIAFYLDLFDAVIYRSKYLYVFSLVDIWAVDGIDKRKRQIFAFYSRFTKSHFIW